MHVPTVTRALPGETLTKAQKCPNNNPLISREDKLKHHLLKGCQPLSGSGELDQSMDSRDSEEAVARDEQEIDDDEDNK